MAVRIVYFLYRCHGLLRATATRRHEASQASGPRGHLPTSCSTTISASLNLSSDAGSVDCGAFVPAFCQRCTERSLSIEPEDLVGADEEFSADLVVGVPDAGRAREGAFQVALTALYGGQVAADLMTGSGPGELSGGAGRCQYLREPAQLVARHQEGVVPVVSGIGVRAGGTDGVHVL